MTPHLRIARPAADLERLARMYREGLGFIELSRFADHDGFNGVMLGWPQAGYHLEFTQRHGTVASAHAHANEQDEHLLVFYEPLQDRWRARCDSLLRAGFRSVPNLNPYWNAHGQTFADAEGGLVVIARMHWPPQR